MPTGRDHRSPGEDAAPGSPRGLLHGLAPRRRDVQTVFISRGRYPPPARRRLSWLATVEEGWEGEPYRSTRAPSSTTCRSGRWKYCVGSTALIERKLKMDSRHADMRPRSVAMKLSRLSR